MCSQIFFTIKGPLKPSENVMNIHFHGGTIEQFWVKDASFYLIFLCIFWQFFEFFFAQKLKLSVNYLKNSFPCSKNYLICLNLSLNTPYFTSISFSMKLEFDGRDFISDRASVGGRGSSNVHDVHMGIIKR